MNKKNELKKSSNRIFFNGVNKRICVVYVWMMMMLLLLRAVAMTMATVEAYKHAWGITINVVGCVTKCKSYLPNRIKYLSKQTHLI